MKELSIIVLREKGDLLECIQSFSNINLNNKLEIILIINKNEYKKIDTLIKKEIEQYHVKVLQFIKDEVTMINYAINKSKGQYLLILSDNCKISEKNNINEIIKYLKKNKDISTIISSYYYKTNDGRMIIENPLKGMEINDPKEIIKMISVDPWFGGPLATSIYRKKNIKKMKIKEKDKEIFDILFRINALINSKIIQYNSTPTIIWKSTETVQKNDEKKIKKIINIISKIKSKNELNEEERITLATNIILHYIRRNFDNRSLNFKNYYHIYKYILDVTGGSLNTHLKISKNILDRIIMKIIKG